MRTRRTLTRGGHQEEDEPILNLTPLIDVVFVVLILFILIAPMLEVDRVDLAQGKGGEEKAEKTSSLTLHVKEDNSVWLQGKKVALNDLVTLLKQEKALHPQATPQLFHDKKASFGTYQTIKNSVEKAGFENMDLLLEPGPP